MNFGFVFDLVSVKLPMKPDKIETGFIKFLNTFIIYDYGEQLFFIWNNQNSRYKNVVWNLWVYTLANKLTNFCYTLSQNRL